METLLHPTNPTEKPDVAVLNEVGTLALQNVLRDSGYATTRMYGDRKTKHDYNAVTVAWDPAVFRLVEERLTVLCQGAAKLTPVRVHRRPRLEHIATGLSVWRPGTHTPHHVDQGGVARVTDQLPGQNDRARECFAKIAADVLTDSQTAPVEGSGDLNVDYLAEVIRPPARRTQWFPLTIIGKVAAFANPDRGTHGGRCIDQRWIRGRVRVLSIKVLPKRSSDHNPVLALCQLY